MRIFLQVKIYSLAEEARYIRRKEAEQKKRGNTELLNRLHQHRIHHIRPETRAAHLAYGFLRGRSYDQIEGKAKRKPNWKTVERLIKKYGEGTGKEQQAFEAWKPKE